MNEVLTIYTTGALFALFSICAAFFWFTPSNGRHKESLFRMSALMYLLMAVVSLILPFAFVQRPDLVIDWQANLAVNVQIFPFITFVVREMLCSEKAVYGKTIFQHTVIPLSLLFAYQLTCYLLPDVSEWFFWLIVAWAIAYVGIMAPKAVVRVRRYNALVQEIFVDVDGHSLVWLARMSVYLFVVFLVYSICILFELNFLTSWIFNVLAFVFFLVLALQISRMRSNTLIRMDQLESATKDEVLAGEDAAVTSESDAVKFIAELEQWLLADDHLRSGDLNREMVSRAMCTNHVTLARILRQQLGMTLTQYVNDLRLREAERLLQDTGMTIEEIYIHVGYQTRSTFSRAFQERNNCTATEWREQHMK